jgi:hypothetical protein
MVDHFESFEQGDKEIMFLKDKIAATLADKCNKETIVKSKYIV